jgi:hypothetical protein
MDWIIQNKDQAPMNREMKLRVPKVEGNFYVIVHMAATREGLCSVR